MSCLVRFCLGCCALKLEVARRASNRILLALTSTVEILLDEALVMTKSIREKFSCEAAPEVLAALRQIAESQGRPFQAVLDEALRDYIDRQQRDRSRRCRHVMTAFAASIDEFDDLYRELTK